MFEAGPNFRSKLCFRGVLGHFRSIYLTSGPFKGTFSTSFAHGEPKESKASTGCQDNCVVSPSSQLLKLKLR